jgi:protein-L-isoaspartate(D-aspartate) O-methyltransferase
MENFVRQRQHLVDGLRRAGITSESVLGSISMVPRELFVPAELQHEAYVDAALPIGEDQTISQPYMVAWMTQLLELSGVETVLEVGTGSGYQAAVLAALARQVVTIERLPSLSEAARHRLTALGITNVEFHVGDGSLGYPPRAPYEAIIVTAGAPGVPPALFAQLREGGRLVLPIGTADLQDLCLVVKSQGRPRLIPQGGCRFVPLIGEAGWEAAPG